MDKSYASEFQKDYSSLFNPNGKVLPFWNSNGNDLDVW